jgi:hypothetical protein
MPLEIKVVSQRPRLDYRKPHLGVAVRATRVIESDLHVTPDHVLLLGSRQVIRVYSKQSPYVDEPAKRLGRTPAWAPGLGDSPSSRCNAFRIAANDTGLAVPGRSLSPGFDSTALASDAQDDRMARFSLLESALALRT